MLFSWRDCSSFTRLWPLTLLERKKSPWFNLWQYGLITCELLILPPLEEIFSPPKWELIFKADGNPLSANMWFIITMIKPEETWLQYMWWEHIQKPFTWFTHNQQTAEVWQTHFQGTTNDHPHTDRVLAAAFSTAATRPLCCTDHWLDEGRQQRETISNITEEKDEKLIRLHPKLILWGE